MSQGPTFAHLSTSHPTRTELARLLALSAPEAVARLHAAARAARRTHGGDAVYLRGLIEMSNRCARDCLYCGIRRSNDAVERYLMPVDEIVAAARWAIGRRFGSLVIQGGERSDAAFVDHVTAALEAVRKAVGPDPAITLSMGEQTAETYRRWFDAGADRYLLRVETTDADLYRALHPDHPDLDARIACLGRLRDGGWQVGTGVMAGLPGQTLEQLADDVLFFRDIDVDMIGMGPYIPHEGTPLAARDAGFDPAARLRLGLNLIAVTRLVLPDANIAASTALHALADDGRERGVAAGANVVMPNVTDVRYREGYKLYDGKPGVDETADESLRTLATRLEGIGATIGFGERGDALRWRRRVGEI